MSWKIRFYSGLNQGVEVPLAEGRVVIGSDPLQADLVLVDEGIAPVHLVLDVDPQGVRLLEWAEGNQPLQGASRWWVALRCRRWSDRLAGRCCGLFALRSVSSASSCPSLPTPRNGGRSCLGPIGEDD